MWLLKYNINFWKFKNASPWRERIVHDAPWGPWWKSGHEIEYENIYRVFFPVVTLIKPWKGLTMTVVESHCVGHCTQEWTKCSKTYLWKEIYMASVIKNRMNSPLEILFLPLGPLCAVIKYLSSTVSIFRSQFWCYVYNIYSFFIFKKMILGL